MGDRKNNRFVHFFFDMCLRLIKLVSQGLLDIWLGLVALPPPTSSNSCSTVGSNVGLPTQGRPQMWAGKPFSSSKITESSPRLNVNQRPAPSCCTSTASLDVMNHFVWSLQDATNCFLSNCFLGWHGPCLCNTCTATNSQDSLSLLHSPLP